MFKCFHSVKRFQNLNEFDEGGYILIIPTLEPQKIIVLVGDDIDACIFQGVYVKERERER